MSYDITLEIDTGDEYPAEVAEIGNYTSNVSQMWTLALSEPLKNLSGRRAGDCVKQLEEAVRVINDPARAAEFKALEPKNGWGSHEGAARYLSTMLAQCKKHPKCSIHVCC